MSKIFKNIFFLRKVSYCNMSFKHMNILVQTEKNCSKLYKNIEENIYKCVSPDNYLVYQILDSEVLTQPWLENTSLLVLASKEVGENEATLCEKYIKQSGKILLICSKFNNLVGFKCLYQPQITETLADVRVSEVCDVPVVRGKCSYISSNSEIIYTDKHNKPVIQKISVNGGIFIASEVYVDRDLIFLPQNLDSLCYNNENRLLMLKNILIQNLELVPKHEDFVHNLTHGYYISDYESLKLVTNKSQVFHHCSVKHEGKLINLNIYYYSKHESVISFDLDLYFLTLNTEKYGHKFIYFSTITSTMDIAEQLSDTENVVIFASIQTSGRGRGGNKWISPHGCAMFTLCLTVDLFSNLGQKLSFIQHMAALSVVHGIRNQKQFKDLDIKIKWPNDIYFNNFKIGGLIVTSSMQDKKVQVKIGWGVNVTNSSPSVCLNDVIKMHNETNSSNIPYLHVEEVVALTVSQMQYFIKDFQTLGADKTFNHYYSYWMHGNQNVTIENLNEKGTVIGIDDYGFLVVKTSKGEKISLQPDGNRFDITKNLIYLKEKHV